METTTNCPWPGNDQLMRQYHDLEWGVPLHNDQKLFEFLTLDAFQAGLSWRTILHKRENFRRAFQDYDVAKIALFDEETIQALMQDASIVRNQQKIRATVGNAKAFIKVCEEFGTFDKYIWQFTNGETIKNSFTSMTDLPARTPQSDAMSKDLLKRGFKFVGSTICYAFMQAAGMVNDHLVTCNCYHRPGQPT